MANKDQVDFYNKFITHFESQINNKRNVSFREWILKWVTKNSSVLDFGCAYGYNSEFLMSPPSGCDLTGIDISDKCIAKACNLFPDGHWYCHDITETKLDLIQNITFDFVLMSDVLEHIPRQRLPVVCRAIDNWTEKGSVILASVPNAENYAQIKEITFQPVEESIEMFSLLKTFSVNSGFKRIISLFLVDNTYYRIVLQKI